MTLDPRLSTALSDRYRLERELGAGGMATVYLAHDLKHDRQVAIKVLRPELAALIGAERFLSEIRTTARLQHPNIVPLFDSGVTAVRSQQSGDGPHERQSPDSRLPTPDSFLYYVMPFLDGESLRQRMTREHALPVEEAVRLAREVADALGYAHGQGIVHRDIKPENIMLQSGHAVVADFGIARAMSVAGSERVTQAGMALGTPAYMSPEQAAGERDVDGRADQYALASVLYEMLAGEPPFTGATMEAILVQRFTRPAPRVSLKRPAVPRAIDAAISMAMARAPEERFASMARFIAGLNARAGGDGELDRSIAVLPFANMSGDPENEYFSDGVSEEIINALSQLPGLRVAARTSAFSFKGRNVDLRSVGDQLDVATVLEGSVRKAGGRIRITAQLIKVADGYHLWSQRYDRELTDVFAIQDEIATAIADKLKVTLKVGNEGQLVRPPTANVAAYDLYLQGHALVRQRGTSLLKAVDCFDQALALDPRSAQVHAELAQALILMSMYGLVRPEEIRDRARESTSLASAENPGLVSGQVALGLRALMVDFDRAAASAAFDRAMALDPLDVDARAFSSAFDLCYTRGLHHAAIDRLRGLIASDPLNANARCQLSIVLTWVGEFDEAVAQSRRGIELDPKAFYPRWTLTQALMLGPDPKAAVEATQPILNRFGRHPWLMMGIAFAYGAAGQRDLAEAIFAELQARSRAEYVQPMALAVAAVGTGNTELTLRYFREAALGRDPLFTAMAIFWPGLAPIRGTPEFAEVLGMIGWG